ncbi:MAG: glycerophosphodiester phosphodiesterase [Bacteroidaceae bacterium]|nr:glycerophosphodiester phosphodiesterase [Bacteroidaceae bacterium]
MNYKKLLAAGAFAFAAASAFAQTQEIRCFSHRGGRMEHDENTMQAFQASYDAGYRGFETDIRMTKDGELFITHDSNLERTTNGSGAIEEKTAAEIRALYTKKGNKMLTLDELVAWLKGKKGLYVEFELKTKPENLYPEERLHKYCDMIYQKVMAIKPADAQFVFTSGDYRGLRYLQQKYPGVDLLLITSKPCNDETIALCKAMGITRMGATMDGTSRAAVKKAHKEGLIVSLWPGQSTADFMLGAYLGCDYMCTDIPLEVKDFLAKKAPWIKVKY